MKKIKEINDLELIKDSPVLEYVENLLRQLIEILEVEDIEPYGAIFCVESEEDLMQHRDFCLATPLTPQRFEWISDIGSGYLCGCVVINNSKVISIVGKAELLNKYKEDENENHQRKN